MTSQWITKKPTEPGWYWFRYWRYNGKEPTHTYIVRVFSDANGLQVDDGQTVETMQEFAQLHPVSPVKVEFAGPIQEPQP